MGETLSAGAEIVIAHPFVREEVELYGELTMTWRPGLRYEAETDQIGDYRRVWTAADGIGEQILTVVSVHQPGRFPTRVFFTRKWRAPDGKVFGATKLHIKTLAAFRRIVRGYRHEFEVAAASAALGR